VPKEIDKLLIGSKFNEEIFKPYRVSEETRQNENLNSKYTVLFWSGMKEKETERIETLKDGASKIHYKHTFVKTKFKKSLFEIIVPKLFSQLFNLNAINQYKEFDERKIQFEYISEVDLLNQSSGLVFEDHEKISASISVNYFIKSFKYKKSGREKMMGLLNSYAYVDPQITKWIKNKELVCPMDLQIKTSINEKGLRYFNNINEEIIHEEIKSICSNEAKLKNKSIFSFLTIKKAKKSCEKKINKAYRLYNMKLLEDSESLPIKEFKNLFEVLANYISSTSDIEKLFGRENVFVYGKFNSKTKMNTIFVNNFKHGHSDGLGLSNPNLDMSR
jgi:hypothetical protein